MAVEMRRAEKCRRVGEEVSETGFERRWYTLK